MSDARIFQQSTEVAVTEQITDARIFQQSTEVAVTGQIADARIFQQFIEVAIETIAASQYSAKVLAVSALSSYMKLTEATGAFADSKDAAVGTASGTVIRQQASAVDGLEYGVAFDGGGSGTINFGNIYPFSGNAPFSIIAWVKKTSTVNQDYARILTKENASNTEGWGFMWDANGSLVFQRRGAGSVNYVNTAPSLEVGRFYQVAFTYDGTNMRAYTNAELSNTTLSTLAMTAQVDAMRISNPTSPPRAAIEKLSIYSSALAQAKIQELFNYNVVPLSRLKTRVGGTFVDKPNKVMIGGVQVTKPVRPRVNGGFL